ncbi:MAG: ATP-binding protein [Candidatus Cryptobacteroides sp.]
MISKTFIGREYEQGLVSEYYNSPKSEMVAIYGRRRIGKTYLIKHFFDEQFDFWYTGMYEAPKSVQLHQFQVRLEQYSGRKIPRLKTWFEAFENLKEHLISLGKEKIVVFLDEIPWMDTPKGNFLAAFADFWNMWPSTKANLKLFVCGSATTWMLDNVVGNKGGLYGRVCRPVYLAPFSLGETEKFIRNVKGIELGRTQVLETYMILGGIPYYLDMLERGVPLDKSIDNLFFKKGAPLREEYDFLYRSLFKNAVLYRRIIEVLSNKLKGLSRQEILEALNLDDGGSVSQALEDLCKCDFVRSYSAFGKQGKDTMYQLSDQYSLFYLRFVKNNDGQDENTWSNMRGSGERRSWSGYAFEQTCLHHIRQIKSAMGISGVLSNVFSWQSKPFVDKNGTKWKGGQIDLIIDRADNVVNLCEMKYYSDEYVIDIEDDKRLRERANLFKLVTGTKKAVTHVFITTYGVKRNSYSNLAQANLTMDDLFAID